MMAFFTLEAAIQNFPCLTLRTQASNLMIMLAGRRVLFVALTVALATYALDCVSMTTPEQAMQCCKAMHCHSHHHHKSQDCCKTMPAMHAVLGQPSLAQGVSLSPVVVGLVQAFSETNGLEPSAGIIAEHSHAPPISSLPAVPPLRI
jgi:hypothetical protein